MTADESGTKNQALDVLIIGAGVYGICFVSTHLTLHPTDDVLLVDADESVGGVWSKSRSYPLFWSQSGTRMAGFPDVPYRPPPEAEVYHDLTEAKYLSRYLEDYMDEKVFHGRKMRERFVGGVRVKNVWREDGGKGIWRAKAERGGAEVRFAARKVIVATGLSSLPNMPSFSGSQTFRGPVVHQKDFARSKLFTSDEPKVEQHENTTIYGGGKSAADMAYAAAKDNLRRGGGKVNWIIRSSGTGPLTMINPKSPFPEWMGYKNITEMSNTRGMAALSSANPYLPANSWREWVFGTRVGEWLLDKIWKTTESLSTAGADFSGREGRLEGFEGLMPTPGVSRWHGGPFGFLQREDFWDTIARNVRIWRGEIMEAAENAVVLEDGRGVQTDVLLCATGWKQEFPFFPPSEAARLGLPIPLREGELVEEERRQWKELDIEAEEKVFQRWPRLKEVPRTARFEFGSTPYRLYRYALPVSDPTIAFLGLPLVPNSYHTALVQSLLAIAHLDGHLCQQNQSPCSLTAREMRQDVAFINAWSRIRYPMHGALGNVVVFEMLSYTDAVLAELGLKSHRASKRERMTWKGWWRDVSAPALAEDYAGLVEEFRWRFGYGKG
jgi:dimethylaniline monooxygenase (N-oxide forming)